MVRRTAYRCGWWACKRPAARLGGLCRGHALQHVRASAHPRNRSVALLAWSRAGRRHGATPMTVQAGLFERMGWVA
jgi:hypothetical protein